MTQSWKPLDKKQLEEWKKTLDGLAEAPLEKARSVVTEYYQYLTQHKIAYGIIASQVVQNSGAGKLANRYTEEFAREKLGQKITETQWRTLFVGMAIGLLDIKIGFNFG